MKINITAAAKTALQRLIRDSSLENPYITIVGGTDPVGKNWGWNVGLYGRERITSKTTPPSWILAIDELSFVIDSQWHAKLDGKTLDFVEGHFRVV